MPTPTPQTLFGQGLVESEQVNEFVRSAALDTFLVLEHTDQIPRDAVVDYFRSLLCESRRLAATIHVRAAAARNTRSVAGRAEVIPPR